MLPEIAPHRIPTTSRAAPYGSAEIKRGSSAIFGLCGGAYERDRACGPGQAASRLLLGFDDALRAQKRGADGSDHSARTDRSPASVAAAFYRRGKMVGREGSREGAGTGAAAAGTPRPGRSVDHR